MAPAIAIRWYSQLGLPFHVCGSEGALSEDYVLGLECGAKYVEVPQGRVTTSSGGDDVLREKFNDSLATHEKHDWYCLVGADDCVSLDFFSQLEVTKQPMMAGIAMHCPLFIHNLLTGESVSLILLYKQKFKLLPGVNAFNLAGMQACGWKPYQRRGCETGAELLFRDIGRVRAFGGAVVSVKGDNVLNTYDKLCKVHRARVPNASGQNFINTVLKHG